MKKQSWILLVSALSMLGFASFGHAASRVDVLDAVSAAYPGEINHFAVATDDSGDLTGIVYGDSSSYTLTQLQNVVVLIHNNSPSVDVIKLDLDEHFSPKDGGLANIYYMGSVFKPHTYGVFTMELVRAGAGWAAYGHNADGSRGALILHLDFETNYSHLLHRVIGVSGVRAW